MRILILLLTLVATPAAAFEETGNPVADGFLNVLESGGYDDVTVQSVDRADGTTVLSGVSATARDREETLEMARVEIAGGLIDADNTLIADRIRYGDVRVTSGGDQAADSTAASMTVTDARLPVRSSAGSWLATVFGTFATVTIEDLVARPPARTEVRVGRIEVASTGPDDGVGLGGRVALSGIDFDVAFLQGAAAAFLRSLGYDRLTVDAALSGRWDRTGGRAAVEDVTLRAGDLGAVTLDAAVDGMSAETVAALRTGLSDFSRVLSVLQGVRVSSLSVGYTDLGLAERLLAQAAEARGTSVEAVADEAVASVRSALGVVGDPDFTNEVASALAAFLEEPGTLTLSVQPSQQVTVAQVFGGALMRPEILPELLNVKVSATAP